MTLRSADREEIQIAWMWAVAVGAALILRPLWLSLAGGLPACPFRTLTGIPCPTCGTTHAAIALLHLRIGAALQLNPLAAAAGIAFVVGGGLAPLWALFVRRLPALPRPLPLPARLAMAAALAANWLWVILANR